MSSAPRQPDTRVAYPVPVSERKVDRDAWANLLQQLIDQESGGNKAAFARRVGIPSVRSLDRWLARSVNVSEESVRQIARELSLPVVDMLVLAGFYRPDEMSIADQREREHMSSGEDADAVRTIEESDAPPSLKRELLEHLRTQRVEHERQRLAEIQRMIELARRHRSA